MVKKFVSCVYCKQLSQKCANFSVKTNGNMFCSNFFNPLQVQDSLTHLCQPTNQDNSSLTWFMYLPYQMSIKILIMEKAFKSDVTEYGCFACNEPGQ